MKPGSPHAHRDCPRYRRAGPRCRLQPQAALEGARAIGHIGESRPEPAGLGIDPLPLSATWKASAPASSRMDRATQRLRAAHPGPAKLLIVKPDAPVLKYLDYCLCSAQVRSRVLI